MNKNASPGVFGLDISTLKILFKNDNLANTICTLLNRWVFERDCSTELFLALLSAIPKQDKDTNHARNLRPISVTSIWYRLVAKIFQDRL